MIEIRPRRPLFHRSRFRSNPYIILVLLALVVGSIFLLKSIETRQIVSPFEPTPTPTRTANSYALEGETYFQAGNLPAAITAYQRAIEVDPNNVELYAELARIQVYSSSVLSTDADRRQRLLEARAVSEKAVELDPQSSLAAAINAFVLDWNANPTLYDAATAQKTLLASELEAVRALNLDKNNTLAMAYYAEILTDQQKIVQARQYIQQALATGEQVMDVHRVLAYVNEAEGNYGDAIQQYKIAVEITPNLTNLYISIGLNYRVLGEKENNPKSEQYNFALEYFEKAVRINQQNQVSDPIPYIAIGKTYAQMGEFFSAARNVRKALAINPNNPDVYGTLGLVYFRARNYESAIPALKCATYGCTAEESCDVRQCDSEADSPLVIEGMPLSQNTVIYYYTYGSVLAGMHRPGLTYCTDAVKTLSEVRNSFSADVDIMSIVEASEVNLCSLWHHQPTHHTSTFCDPNTIKHLINIEIRITNQKNWIFRLAARERLRYSILTLVQLIIRSAIPWKSIWQLNTSITSFPRLARKLPGTGWSRKRSTWLLEPWARSFPSPKLRISV